MTTEADSSGISMSNQSYLSDSFTMMRIDARELIVELEAFYRGQRVVGWTETDNAIKPAFETIGEPRMNSIGVQDMMAWLKSLFNPQTVQGNMNEIDLSNFLADLRLDLATNLMENLNLYNIKESDFNGIIDKTLVTAVMFFSRTKDNLERESYAQTTKSVEHMSERHKGFSLNPFKT